MRNLTFLALATTFAALPMTSAALPLVGPQLAQRIHNAEFRGYTRTARGFENQIWHFRPDGAIRAVADARTQRWPGREEYLEWQDIGAWRIEGDRVCVAFAGVNRNLGGCYAVEVGAGIHVRLIGPYVWQGTLQPSH